VTAGLITAGMVTPEHPALNAASPLSRVGHLCLLATEDLLGQVTLHDLRALHPELMQAGVQLVVKTAGVHEVVTSLLRAPRPAAVMLVVFVIRGEEIRSAGFTVTRPDLRGRDDRADLAALFEVGRPGDRVVVIGLTFGARHRVDGLSGMYEVITLT